MMTKILKSLNEVSKVSLAAQKKHRKVGLVVGGFDILHLGHLNLFRLSKKHVDVLTVGLDNDATLKTTKGENRPINNYFRRSQFLSDITNVDYIFKINKVFKHGDSNSISYFKRLYKKIRPTHIFTHTSTDTLKSIREKMAKSLGIKFIPDNTKTITYSSIILKKLEGEL